MMTPLLQDESIPHDRGGLCPGAAEGPRVLGHRWENNYKHQKTQKKYL